MKILTLIKKQTKNGDDYLLVNNKYFAWKESKDSWIVLEDALENKKDINIEIKEGKFPQITKIGDWEVPKKKFTGKTNNFTLTHL